MSNFKKSQLIYASKKECNVFLRYQSWADSDGDSEAASRGVLSKKVFLKMLQIS